MAASASATVAFLYPGQGSQRPGMGRAAVEAFPEARKVFEQADEAVPMSISALCFDGSEDELRRTENTQPAILTVSVAIHRVLDAHGIAPGWVAGHSLGEYSALVAAGALEISTAAPLVHNRGRYMQEAVPEGTGAMAAILGLEAAAVERLCADHDGDGVVQVANLNAPEQVVVAGHRESVEGLVEAAKGAGARRALLLNVSAPFHCSLMQPAAERLAVDLGEAEFANPCVPVVCNVDALPVSEGGSARDALERQVTRPVRWVETLEFLVGQGVRVFVEVGPGRVLSGLVKRTLGRDVEIHAVEGPEDVEAVTAALASSSP